MTRFRKHVLTVSLLVLAAALSGCGKGKDADEAAKPVALVTTAVVGRGALDDTLTAYGAAEFAPGGERTLAAPAEAVVVRVDTAAGARVQAGQVLVELKSSPATALDLRKAELDAQTASAALARAERLRTAGLDSDADVETARNASGAAAETLKSMRARAGQALVVRATEAGVVETLTAAPGDVVASGASLGKIGALNALRIRLGVDPAALARVHAGASVKLTPLSGGEAREAKVSDLDPRADAQTRLASAIVSGASGFAPGVPLKGDILIGRRGDGPVVPRAAVLWEQDQPYVFVVEKGAAKRHDLKLGVTSGDQVEVVSGLNGGERIVVDGGAALDDGTAVREGPLKKNDDAKGDAKGGKD